MTPPHVVGLSTSYTNGARADRQPAVKLGTKQAFGGQEVRVGRLDGKVALITGGARGMGKSHVRHFVAEGARVVFGDVLDDKGRFVAAKLPEGTCRYVHHDVTSEDDWAAAVSTTLEAFGQLDVLVNNAGVLTFAPIAEMPAVEFRRVLEVNAVGCWLGMKSVIAPMTAAGGGSIVNISSVEGFTGASGLSAYSASKFAVRGMTKAAAQELGQFGIRVNSVHPGGVLTSMTLSRADTFDHVDPEALLKSMPIARFAEPAEISRLVMFLASDESSYSTGSEFTADGGLLSGPGY
jgi:3alpha(or 20beta)-hydroxysteroid dehydrogenase